MAAKAKDDDSDTDDKAKPGFDPKAVKLGEESLVDRILPHVKKILVMFVLAAFVISVVLVIRWRKTVKLENATQKLGEVLDTARKPVNPEAKPDDKDNKDVFKSSKDRANAVLDSMVKGGADGSPSYKGGMLLDAGKYDEAIAEFRAGENKADIEGVLCREGIGLALEAKAMAEKDATARQKGLEEALAAFTNMQPDETGPRRAHALYHIGRLQQTLGKTAEAKASYEKAKTLALVAEPPSPEPSINHYQLPQLIERRLSTM
jgi:tetratricopeptide (TPR) repeat protein